MDPVVRIGTRLDIDGHTATVVAITRNGVKVDLGGQVFEVERATIERAIST